MHTPDDISNDISRETFALIKPTIDHCVVKAARRTFEKLPDTPNRVTFSYMGDHEVKGGNKYQIKPDRLHRRETEDPPTGFL